MKFLTLAQCYSDLEKTSKILEMIDILSNTLKNANAEEIGKIALFTIGKLHPEFLGIELMLAERMTIKAISMATGKNEKIIQKVLASKGDLGETTYYLFSKKPQTSITSFFGQPEEPYQPEFLEVWEKLDAIARMEGEGSADKKVRTLAGLLARISPLEAKYIVRMVCGELRLGVAAQILLEALALAKTGDRANKAILERAYNRCSDLSYVAETLYKGGIEAVRQIDVKIFRPIKVMLAQRVSSAEELFERFGTRVALEYKYDGLRVQIHKQNNKIELFSRRPERITDQFPDVCEHILTATDEKEIILEGEIVAYDFDKNKILPFQILTQRKRKYGIEEKSKEIPVKVFLFDVLFANNTPTLDLPYLKRREILKEVIKETRYIQLSHQKIAYNPDDVEAFFYQAIHDGCEGIMGKSVKEDSVYQAGARGWNWVKYKADYVKKLSDSFDLVILGADYGKGKRTGKYGSFLLGCYNKDMNRFETFTRVATGFSDEDLERFYDMLKPLERQKEKDIFSDIECDVWFQPKIVIEVSGAEITRSPSHTCARGLLKNPNEGLALRFPRFTGKIDDDRNPEDATSTEEILLIYERQSKER